MSARLRPRRRSHVGRGRTPSGRGGAAPGACLVAGLLFALVLLVSQARLLWFFGDDWAFLVGSERDGSLLEPHNEHWSTLPLVAYRVMVRIFGIDHYLAWAMMPIALHLAIGVLLHLLLRRHGVPAWPAVIAALTLVLLPGAIAENPLWPFQIGFLGSAFLGLLALLAVSPRPDEPVRADTGTPRLLLGLRVRALAVVWVATVLSMMSSGMALTMLVWLGLRLLLAGGLRQALVATVPPAVVYLGWFAAYGRGNSAAGAVPDIDASLIFTWAGVAHVWQNIVGITDVGGPFVVVLLLVTVLPRGTQAGPRALALAGLGAMFVMYALISLSRADLGPAGAVAGRYAYFALLMTVPAFAILLTMAHDRMAERPRERLVAAAVVVFLLALTGVGQTVDFRQDRQTATPDFKARVLAAVQFLRSDEPVFENATIDPVYAPDLTAASLDQPEVLARFADVPASRQTTLDGAVSMQAEVSTSSLDLPRADKLIRGGVQGQSQPATGCSTVHVDGPIGSVDLPPSATGVQVVVVPTQTSLILQAVARRAQYSRARFIAVTPGVPVYVGSVSQSLRVRILLPRGATDFCADLS